MPHAAAVGTRAGPSAEKTQLLRRKLSRVIKRTYSSKFALNDAETVDKSEGEAESRWGNEDRLPLKGGFRSRRYLVNNLNLKAGIEFSGIRVKASRGVEVTCNFSLQIGSGDLNVGHRVSCSLPSSRR